MAAERVTFQKLIDDGTLLEVYTGVPFDRRVKHFDQVLFPEGTEEYSPVNWRDRNVGFGAYLAPDAHNVPQLMNQWGSKVDSFSDHFRVSPFAQKAEFLAWETVTFLGTHPKRDGNGRLAKAQATWLSPNRDFFKHYSKDWGLAIVAFEKAMLDETSRRTGKPIPEELLKVATTGFGNAGLEVYYDFFRYGGRDLSSEILADRIDRAILINGHVRGTGIIAPAVEYMTNYMLATPLRQKPNNRS